MASTASGPRVPIWPALVFLVWTCLGLFAFVMQSSQDLGALARTDPLQAKIWSEMPQWAWISYGLSVGAGFAGAIALLLRRKSAVWLAAICVIAVIMQFSYTFLMTDLLALKGWTTVLFPLFILVMAIAQLLYARSLHAKGALR